MKGNQTSDPNSAASKTLLASSAGELLGTIRVDEQQHLEFSTATGDINGIHVSEPDAKAAGFEHRIVHGVHLIFRALELYLKIKRSKDLPASLSCRFAKPLFVGEQAEVRLKTTNEEEVLWLQVGSLRLMELRLGKARATPSFVDALASWDFTPPLLQPLKTDIRSIPAGYFTLPLFASISNLKAAFPKLAALLGERRLSAIAMQSALVGMYYPGERSLFLSLDLELTDDVSEMLQFKINRADPRLGVYDIVSSGHGITSKVRALARSVTSPPIPVSHLRRLPLENKFSGQRAVIVGGSRGLGRLTAALIALGGGKVWLTYSNSRESAKILSDEINGTNPASANFLPMTVSTSGDVSCNLPSALRDINAIYYFATPQIFERGSGYFDQARYEAFKNFYVRGLFATEELLRDRLAENAVLYFPSTAALDSPVAGMAEYAAAKAEAEAKAPALEQANGKLRVTSGRLPRIATDQTISPIPVHAADGVEIMRAEIERVHDLIARPS